MPTILTDTEITDYFNQKYPDEVRKSCIEAADAIKIHSDGVYPGALIEERRPSESATVKEYRHKIWKPITKIPFNKVITELMKIRKSEEWNIEYAETKVSSKLQEGEKLQDYCEFNYPVFKSITNWAFAVLLKKYLVDPNGIVIVIPQSAEVDQASEFLKPVAHIFESWQVVTFKMEDYVILRSKDKSKYQTKDGSTREGEIFYVIDTQLIRRFDETTPNQKGERMFETTVYYPHELEELPAFAIGSVIKEMRENQIIYESRVGPCCIEFDEAVREYSDLQGGVVKALNLIRWIFANMTCKECNGYGKKLLEGKETVCKSCKGQGRIPSGPYEDLILQPPGIDQQATPIPPMGDVPVDIEILKLQDTRVKAHKWEGLSAINMEFLAEVPLSQSGVAKEVDRDGLNTFVNSVAEDLVAVMDKIYFFINELRNRIRVPNEKERLEQLPKIAVPEHFDYLHSAMMIDKLTKAREAKLHPTIIAALEIDYANSEFNSDPDIRKRLEAIYSLDPFPGISEDEKSTRLANKGISKQNYVISSNIHGFIDRAIIEDDDFLFKEKGEQLEVLKGFADEQIEADSAEAEVMMEAMQGQEDGTGTKQEPPAKAA